MTMTDPNGCRWCGEAMRGHGIRLTEPAGVHGYTEPTDGQRLNRMRARRDDMIPDQPRIKRLPEGEPVKLTPTEREVLAPHLERAARDLAELTAMLEPDVLHTLMKAAEAFGRTYRHPRQIIHNGRKPR